MQADVAAKVGACEPAVWGWESNRAEPELRFLPAVLAFIGYDPRPEPKTLGERLVRIRNTKGLTQAAFARQLGIDPTTLARWERDEREPTGPHVELVAKVLGLGGHG